MHLIIYMPYACIRYICSGVWKAKKTLGASFKLMSGFYNSWASGVRDDFLLAIVCIHQINSQTLNLLKLLL